MVSNSFVWYVISPFFWKFRGTIYNQWHVNKTRNLGFRLDNENRLIVISYPMSQRKCLVFPYWFWSYCTSVVIGTLNQKWVVIKRQGQVNEVVCIYKLAKNWWKLKKKLNIFYFYRAFNKSLIISTYISTNTNQTNYKFCH